MCFPLAWYIYLLVILVECGISLNSKNNTIMPRVVAKLCGNLLITPKCHDSEPAAEVWHFHIGHCSLSPPQLIIYTSTYIILLSIMLRIRMTYLECEILFNILEISLWTRPSSRRNVVARRNPRYCYYSTVQYYYRLSYYNFRGGDFGRVTHEINNRRAIKKKWRNQLKQSTIFFN